MFLIRERLADAHFIHLSIHTVAFALYIENHVYGFLRHESESILIDIDPVAQLLHLPEHRARIHVRERVGRVFQQLGYGCSIVSILWWVWRTHQVVDGRLEALLRQAAARGERSVLSKSFGCILALTLAS